MKNILKYCLIIILLSGCASRKEAQPEIIPDISTCSKCEMLISETQFASYLISDRTYLFDDIGCMMKFIESNKDSIHETGFMDYENKTWISGKSATFIKVSTIITPMNYGFIAVNGKSIFLDGNYRIDWKGNWNDFRNYFPQNN